MKCSLLGGLHRVNQSSSGVEAAGQSLSGMETEGQEEATKECRTQAGKTQGGCLRPGEPSAEPWAPKEEFHFGTLPSEKAACKDSLGFISTPSFFIWGNQLGTGSDLLQITPGVWATRAATSHPLANSPLRESASFFLKHFLFAFSLWFEKRMSSVRASKTWPALGSVSAHTYGSQASFWALREKVSKPERFRPTSWVSYLSTVGSWEKGASLTLGFFYCEMRDSDLSRGYFEAWVR